MALTDLLWACPICGEDRGLARVRRAYHCQACGTAYRRGEGAAILAESPDGERTERPPARWLALLPQPEHIVAQYVNPSDLIRSARVEAAWMIGSEPVYGEDGYLNQVEVWGDPTLGRLELRPDRLVHTPDGAEASNWPLASLTAVQASSRALQLNRVEAPLVQLRFPNDSIFLWENLLREALQALYRRTGRGEIVEYQPRIVTA